MNIIKCRANQHSLSPEHHVQKRRRQPQFHDLNLGKNTSCKTPSSRKGIESQACSGWRSARAHTSSRPERDGRDDHRKSLPCPSSEAADSARAGGKWPRELTAPPRLGAGRGGDPSQALHPSKAGGAGLPEGPVGPAQKNGTNTSIKTKEPGIHLCLPSGKCEAMSPIPGTPPPKKDKEGGRAGLAMGHPRLCSSTQPAPGHLLRRGCPCHILAMAQLCAGHCRSPESSAPSKARGSGQGSALSPVTCPRHR